VKHTVFRLRIVHVENAEVPEKLRNERVQIGISTWRFRRSESSVRRCVDSPKPERLSPPRNGRRVLAGNAFYIAVRAILP